MSKKPRAKRIGRPPGADADQTKAALLDAALEAFAEKGFEGASIREITGSIDVGHNLVRHYFGSKEDLWRAAVRHGLEPGSRRIAEMFDVRGGAEAPPLQATLREGLELLLVEAAENPHAFRLLLAEALRGGPRFDHIFDDLIEPIAEAIFAYAGQTDEIPPDVDLRVLGVFIFGAAFSPFTFEGLASRLGLEAPQRGEPLSDEMEQLIDMIVAGSTRAAFD